PGLVCTLEPHRLDLVAMATRDEPVLEREPAVGGLHPRAEPVARRRQDSLAQAQPLGQAGRDRRERLAGRECLRADEVHPEVAVAEREPPLAAEPARLLERVPRLAGAAPASLVVAEPG